MLLLGFWWEPYITVNLITPTGSLYLQHSKLCLFFFTILWHSSHNFQFGLVKKTKTKTNKKKTHQKKTQTKPKQNKQTNKKQNNNNNNKNNNNNNNRWEQKMYIISFWIPQNRPNCSDILSHGGQDNIKGVCIFYTRLWGEMTKTRALTYPVMGRNDNKDMWGIVTYPAMDGSIWRSGWAWYSSSVSKESDPA